MTQQNKIAVIGAGIMGLSAAHALSAAHDVTVFDSGGKNASSMAGGMLAPYAEIDHLPTEFIQAGLDGIKFWERVPGAEFRRNGTLIIAHKEDTYMLERFAQKLPRSAKANIAALEPSLNKFADGIYLPEEAHINPALAMRALTKNLRIFTKTCDIEKIKNKFSSIIDCRGLGTDDPDLRGVKGEMIIVRNPEFSLSRPVRLMHPRYPLYIVPRPDHEFMIGATTIESADETVTLKSAMELLSAAYSLHPSFGEAEIVEIRAGVRPAYPDNLPRITVKGNIISCNGLFRHGYLLAPVMAKCVADFIAGKENEFMKLFTRKNENNDQRTVEKFKRRA